MDFRRSRAGGTDLKLGAVPQSAGDVNVALMRNFRRQPA